MIMMKLSKRLGGLTAACGLMAAGLVLAGCRSHPSERGSAATGATPGAAGSPAGIGNNIPESEVFRVGDSVTVIFTDLPTPPPAFDVKIKEDGTVTLLLNQTFTFVGKTPGDLEKEVRASYVPRYYQYMTVTIKRAPQTLFYYLDGEVKAPARQTFIERTTVLKAIASAGGFTDFAKKKAVKLTRLDGRKLTINCVKAIDEPSLDVEIYPGDKIYVPRKLW
jgi:protein involved in polysaccharide export with SLBB domain